MDLERAIAQKVQEKYEFYSVSLAFTVLALSVQTAEFGAFPFLDTMELVAWIALLLAGVSGLRRLEFTPCYIVEASKLDEDFEKWIERVRKHTPEAIDGAQLQSADLKSEAEDLKKRKGELDILDGSNRTRYRRHRNGLTVGLLLLVIARGGEPFWNLVFEIYRALPL